MHTDTYIYMSIDWALSIALICSIVSTELSRNCKWHVVMANIYYSYPQMQWLFDVKICIVEIHTSVIILWFFYLYFMKGTKLHWNICCYKRENVDVIWIRLDTTMQCRGINRKDCSQVTDFGNFGFQSLLRRLGVLEKKLKVGSAAPRRLSIFFPKPPTSGAGFETKISKVRHLRAVFTLKVCVFMKFIDFWCCKSGLWMITQLKSCSNSLLGKPSYKNKLAKARKMRKPGTLSLKKSLGGVTFGSQKVQKIYFRKIHFW